MLKTMGEKHRLVLWLLILLGTAFTISSLASYFVSRNSIRREIITNELPLTVDNIYSEIQHDLVRPILISSLMAHDTFLRSWAENGERDPSEISQYLKEIQEKFGTLTCFFVSDRSDTYYYENGVFKKVSVDDRRDAWYWRVRRLTAPYELNVDLDQAHADAMTIFINYRVIGREGKFLGAAGVGLTVNAVRRMLDKYQNHFHRAVYFTDRQGHILLRGDGTGLPSDIHAMHGLKKLAATILNSSGGTYQYVRDGRTRQLNVRFIPELGWYLFVEKAEDEDLANIYHTLLLNLTISGSATLIAVLLTSLRIDYQQKKYKAAVDKHTEELNTALLEASSANRSKSQMLAYISHDLRAPLANIIRNIRMLGTPSADHKDKCQAAIEQSTNHLTALIDELVEYARGELGYFELLPVPSYLYAFLDEIAHEARLLAQQRNNHFTIALTGNIPPVAVFDPKRLRQVLINLLANAAKYVHDGQIYFRVQVLSGSPPGRVTLRFVVEDTGPGIPEGLRERIFEPFQRNDSNQPGTGLGLAIAHQLVDKMGGELRLSAPPPQGGSRFFFDLGFDIAAETDVLHLSDVFSMPHPVGTGRRLLLVCDTAENSDYLYELLSLADFHVVRVHDTETALRLHAEGHFDAVVTDHALPDIDGWELLLHFRQDHEDASILVVLHSARPPVRPFGFPAGVDFDATLLKPIAIDQLFEVLSASPISTPPADETSAESSRHGATTVRGLPTASLLTLRGLVEQGNFSGIEEWIALSLSHYPEYTDFILRISEATQKLDFEELTDLVTAAEANRSS